MVGAGAPPSSCARCRGLELHEVRAFIHLGEAEHRVVLVALELDPVCWAGPFQHLVPPVKVPDTPGTSQAHELPRLLLFDPFSLCSPLEKKPTLYVYPLIGGHEAPAVRPLGQPVERLVWAPRRSFPRIGNSVCVLLPLGRMLGSQPPPGLSLLFDGLGGIKLARGAMREKVKIKSKEQHASCCNLQCI